MRITLGIAALLIGLVGFLGQLLSAVDFRLAQRFGFQEKDEETEPFYRHLELNTARWDVFVLWTLPLAGVLMLVGHDWWPYAALVAGGIHVDVGGREMAKMLGVRAQGVRTGSPREVRLGLSFLTLPIVVGVALIVHALTTLL